MNTRATRGFTLIELMIVVTIIAILASIGYPSYANWIAKTRRSDAQQALLQTAAQMEKFFTECNTYPSTLSGTRSACNEATLVLGTADVTPDGYYQLAIESATAGCALANCFSLTATPVSGKGQDNDGKLRITSLGVKTWDKKNDGSYSVGWNSR